MSLEPSSIPAGTQAEIIKIIRAKIFNKLGVDPWSLPAARDRLEQAAAQAWRDLQEANTALIDISEIPGLAPDSSSLEISITREEIVPGLPREPQAGPAVQIQLPDRTPYLTYLIMGLSIFVYLLQIGTQAVLNYDVPALYGMKINSRILAGEYWRLLTPMLLHGSLVHIGFNMYALYLMGRNIERLFGPVRFLLLFGIAGLAGNIGSFLFTQGASLGSSTAIFGLLGAEGVFIYQHRQLFGSRFQQQLWQIIRLAGINLIIGLSPGIDNWGHIGGLVGGSLFAFTAGPLYLLEGSPPELEIRDKRSQLRVFISAVLLILLLGFLVAVIIAQRS